MKRTIHTYLLAGSIATGLLMASPATLAASFSGTDVTPTTYEVTLKKVEFLNATGAWVTFAEGNYSFDIAGAAPSSAVGSFATGNSLPPGTYSQIRITIGRTYGMVFNGVDAGNSCKTGTGNGNEAAMGLTNVGIGTFTAGGGGTAGTLQQVPIPTGAAVTAALTARGFEEVGGPGGDIRFSQGVNFTVANDSTPPSMQGQL